MATDLTKSLAELGGEIGYEPSEEGFQSALVLRCAGLYGKPLGEFSPGDLRVMIGQDIALQYLVPLALDLLARDPLVEGDYHPGDLLAVVLECGTGWPYAGFWDENLLLWSRLAGIVGQLQMVPAELEPVVNRFRGRQTA